MNNYGSCETVACQSVSEIQELTDRVARIHYGLGETNSLLFATADRVLGSWPTSADGSAGSGDVPTPNGLISAFHAVLERFERELNQTRVLAEKLSRL